jgi:hypothetical protein
VVIPTSLTFLLNCAANQILPNVPFFARIR